MAIVFGGDTGLRQDAFDNMIDGVVGEFNRIKDGLVSNFSRLTGKPAGLPRTLPKENVHVDDGFQNVPGTVFTGSGNIGDVDDIKTRKITTQSPMFTVYIKKKMFWSLRNEHDTKFMDAAEKLFIRASKLLFERKCSQIASYEAMTKLERLIDEEAELDVQNVEQIKDLIQNEIVGEAQDRLDQDLYAAVATDPTNEVFIMELVDTFANELREIRKNADLFIEELNKLAKSARISKQAVHTSWVIDTTNNTDNVKIGRGVGVIELTLVDSVRTNLSLEPGDPGSISFTAQDPYNLMSITNTDVELALSSAYAARARESDPNYYSSEDRDTRSAQEILEEARREDEKLREERRRIFRGSDVADIIFEVNPSSASPNKVTGRVSSISEPFDENNFRIVLLDLPLEQQLTSEEDERVVRIFGLLQKYVQAINEISTAGQDRNQDEDVEYARRQLRKFYLGKSIVQPMDGVHVYIRSNTFRDAEMIGPLSVLLNDSPFIKSFASGGDADGANDAVLREEMKQFNIQNIPVGLYRKLRTSSLLRNAGAHVFGGLISSV